MLKHTNKKEIVLNGLLFPFSLFNNAKNSIVRKIHLSLFAIIAFSAFSVMAQKNEAITYSFPSQSPFIYDISFSKFGEVLFFPDDRTIKAFLFEEQQLIGEFFNGHADAITALAVSYDSLVIVSGDKSSRIVLWNMESRDIIKTIVEHSGAILTLAISPCNTYLASGSADNSVILYNLDKRIVVERFRIFRDNVTSVKFSPDGKWLGAVCGDGQVVLVNMDNKSVSDIKQVNTFLRDIDFNLTDNELVTAGNNGRAVHWSISEKGIISQKLNTRIGFNWLMSIQFSPDGKSFMVADSRGRVRVQTPFGKIEKNLKVPIFKAIIKPGSDSPLVVVSATRGKGVEVFTGFEMNHRL